MAKGEIHSDPLLESTVAGKFKILSVIGTGGVGTVYLAEHEALHRQVAIKVLRGSFFDNDVTALKRFQMEASSLKAMEHDNIVRIIAIEKLPDSNSPLMVLELLNGGSLSDAIKKHGSIPLESCWSIFEQLSAGLAHAHAKNILHRDIKPGNLMFSSTFDLKASAATHLKLVDFGLAKLMETETLQKLTQTGSLMGTPLYMSPEQLSGKRASAAMDVYSAGCVMYECLFGMPPFTGDSFLDIAIKQTESPALVPDHLPDGRPTPVGLKSLLLRTLDKRPDKRIPDGHDLHNWIVLVHSQPNVVPEPLKQTIRRHSFFSFASKIPRIRIPSKVVASGIALMLPILLLLRLSYDETVHREHSEEIMHKNLREANFNCRQEHFAEARANLQYAQQQVVKFPELQTEMGIGVTEAVTAMCLRNEDPSESTLWLLSMATKVPFNSQDQRALNRQLAFYCRLVTSADWLYEANGNNPIYLQYIDDTAPELVYFLDRHQCKVLDGLQGALSAMLKAAGYHATLSKSTADPTMKSSHQFRQERLMRGVLDILEKYPLAPEIPKFSMEVAVPPYVDLLLAQQRYSRLEQYCRLLMSDRAYKNRIRKIWFMPPLWMSKSLFHQHKNLQEAESLLKGVLATAKQSKLEVPNAGAIYFYLGAIQRERGRTQEALVSFENAVDCETNPKQHHIGLLPDIRLSIADLYRGRGDFTLAAKNLQLAKASLPPEPELSQRYAWLLKLEQQIKNRQR